MAGRQVFLSSCDQSNKRYSRVEILGPSLCETSFLRVNRTWGWEQERVDLEFEWSGVSLMSDKSLQSSPTLCDSMDCSPPGSLSMGFFSQGHLSGLPCPPSGDLPDSGIEPTSLASPALAGGFFPTSATWEAHIPYMSTVIILGPAALSGRFF